MQWSTDIIYVCDTLPPAKMVHEIRSQVVIGDTFKMPNVNGIAVQLIR